MFRWLQIAALTASLAAGPALDRGFLVPSMDRQQAPGPISTPLPNADGDVIDLNRALNRMTVKVLLGTHGPHDFLIDTGAQRTSISSDLAQRLGYADGPMVRLVSMSGIDQVRTVHVPIISLSNRTAVRDVVAPMLSSANLGAAGLLGVDALAGQRVVIDLDAQKMQVLPSERTRVKPRPDEIVIEGRNVAGQLILTDAYYAHTRIRVIVDTGSAVTIGNSALREKLARHGGETQKVNLISVTGGVVPADYGLIDDLWLKDIHVQNMAVAFADVEPFRQFGLLDKPALLLGMDMVRKFRRVEIDFANRQVHFVMPQAG